MANDTDLVLKTTNNYVDTLLKRESKALPAGFDALRFKQNAMTVLKDTVGLDKLKGNEYTLARTIMKGAYLGLDFFTKECYCIVYGNKAEFQTDYKGEKKLAKKYSVNPIKDIYAKLVREGDKFTEKIVNGLQSLDFEPIPFNNGDIIGAFAVALFKDGSMMYETMSKEEIEGVRNNYSKAKNSTAWSKSTGEMYKKTVLRRLCKNIELDFETIEQKKTFDEASGMEFSNNKEEQIKEVSQFEVTDVEYKEVGPEEQSEAQQDLFEGSPFDGGETNGTK
ncbi:RecT family recombinase [Clostridium sp. UBA2485]|uniref:RecT family recombinase n=1 Tax=Clostridium sp. UBA2485 TaxID=1946352 RepID=UPI0025BAD5FF|nr:RecT family recombinase [Clostridium sp. UBA2485]